MTEIGRTKNANTGDDNNGSSITPHGNKTITLVAEDGQRMLIDSRCTQQVGILRAMTQIHQANAQSNGASATAVFPLPAVKSTILSKIVEYLEAHKDDPPRPRTRQPVKVTSRTRAVPGASSNNEAREGGNVDYVYVDDDDDDDDDDKHQGSSRAPDSTVENGQDDESSDDEDFLYEEYLASVSPWDQRFMESLDLPALIEMTKAVNYLNIPPLLDLCCRTIARQMTGLKTEELRKKFNLQNDLTPEEEAKLAAEFAWIEE